MEQRDRWILLIKELRAHHGVNILNAERIALSDAHWRRWVERQINSDAKCRKLALHHIRRHGSGALLEQVGVRITVR
jgi:hypothetical protein